MKIYILAGQGLREMKWKMCWFVLAAAASVWGQRPTSAGVKAKAQVYPPALIEAGQAKFQQNCAFCHGRDTTGGESGPDLTHSGVVAADVDGDKISEVMKNGRAAGMPKFSFTTEETNQLVAFIHNQAAHADSDESKRRKIGLPDLLSGNVEAGKKYFEGTGGCAGCHSVSGDLAKVATKYDPVRLETRMLYPANAPATATVTTATGETVKGRLKHADEFTLTLIDAEGRQRSWNKESIKFAIDAPAEAHLKLIPQYTDADVHNLFAYLNTLR